MEVLLSTVVKIQALVRGFIARKISKEMKQMGALGLIDDIKGM